MLYVLHHLAAAVSVFVAVAFAGDVLRWAFLRHADLGRLDAIASRILGLAFWVAALFALAATGFLALGPIVGLAMGCAVAKLVVIRQASRNPLVSEGSIMTTPGTRRAAMLGFGIVTSGIVIPLLLLCVGPTVSWDADVYHLTLPRIFLEAGGFVTLPSLVYQHWPLGTELLYGMAMAIADYPAAKVVHFGFGLLVLQMVFQAIFRRTSRRLGDLGALALGWAAVALLLANDVFVFEMRVAYVELMQAVLLLGAVLVLDRATRIEKPLPLVALAGVACGLIAGTKVTGLMWALPVALVYVGAVRRHDSPMRHGPRAALAFGLPIALLWLPWSIKVWAATGDPLYPMLWSTLGGPWWDADIAARFTAWQRGIGMGRELIDYLLLPVRVILEGGPGYDRFDGSLTPAWLVAAPLAALGAWRDRLARHAVLVAGGGFVLWAASSQQMRFLVPLLPLVAVASAIGLASVVGHMRPRLQPIVLSALALSMLLVAATAHARILRAGFGRWAIYRSQPAEALYARAAPPVFSVIDRLPADASLLMIDTNRGFFARRPYVADSFFEASQIRAWLLATGGDRESIESALRDAGITHVLVGNRRSGIDWPPGLGALLTESRVVHQDGQHRLLALPVAHRGEGNGQ